MEEATQLVAFLGLQAAADRLGIDKHSLFICVRRRLCSLNEAMWMQSIRSSVMAVINQIGYQASLVEFGLGQDVVETLEGTPSQDFILRLRSEVFSTLAVQSQDQVCIEPPRPVQPRVSQSAVEPAYQSSSDMQIRRQPNASQQSFTLPVNASLDIDPSQPVARPPPKHFSYLQVSNDVEQSAPIQRSSIVDVSALSPSPSLPKRSSTAVAPAAPQRSAPGFPYHEQYLAQRSKHKQPDYSYEQR